MYKLLVPVFAVLLAFSACTGDITPPDDTSKEQQSTDVSVGGNDTSVPEVSLPDEDGADRNALPSPDGNYILDYTDTDNITITDKDGKVSVLNKNGYPPSAMITAALWENGGVYITFTSDKDTIVFWDGESDPVYIKEGEKNTFSPLVSAKHGVIGAGEYEIIPYHDGSMDSPIMKKIDILGYVINDIDAFEESKVLTVDENAESFYLVTTENCKVTVLEAETGNKVSDTVSLEAGVPLLINCSIPEGMPAYKLSLEGENGNGLYTLAYDGRGESNVYFINIETVK